MIHTVGRFRLKANSEPDSRQLGLKLRRALLDDVPGMAATAVRIEGVSHEFQPIPGVREDALELIQSIKRVRIRASADSAHAALDASQPEVRASELKLDVGEVANPELVLAHVSHRGRLKAQIVFECGTGHRAGKEAPEGFIPVDAWFCPVLRVAVTPQADALGITIRTDGSISAEEALRTAMELSATPPEYEVLAAEHDPPTPQVELGPELRGDPFAGIEPPAALKPIRDSFERFLTRGIPQLLESLFPLAPASEAREGAVLSLLDYRLDMPTETPEQCRREGDTYQARLVLKTRLTRNEGQLVFSYRRPLLVEEEVEMGPIPLMTKDGGFVIHGASRACVTQLLDGNRVHLVGDLLTERLAELIARLKPVMQERMEIGQAVGPADVLGMLPLSTVIFDVLARSTRGQYMDETNLLASLVHKTRVVHPRITDRDAVPDGDRAVTSAHFGRIGYAETPEGPNAGLIQTLCLYAELSPQMEILTPYRKIAKGKAGKELVSLTAEQEAGHLIADWSAVGRDGKLSNEVVLAREGDDVKRIPASEADLAAVSPVQALSTSTALIPLLGHDHVVPATLGSNMQRQAVPLVTTEQPLVKSGVEARAALDSGHLLTARRAGEVIEVTSERIVILAGAEKDAYELSKFRRSNQATCWNQVPTVTEGQMVSVGQVLADVGGSCGGELGPGRNVLVAYMPFRGFNFEDAICVSEELLQRDVFTSVHIEWYGADVGEAEVWMVPVGTRVRPGDVLVQESKGRKAALLVCPPYSPAVVVDSVVRHGQAKVYLAYLRRLSVGDKLAGRHGNKGVVAKVLPVSRMPHLEDGTPVQMVLNTLGVVSRLNLGQILEAHYGLLAHTLGTQFVIPPFMTPPHDLLRKKLKEAGLSETGMVPLYDGDTGRAFDSPVTVGYLYMLKLSHCVDDKMHAVAVGSPSLLTRQTRYWGQRLGSLEMWALEAYGAGSNLQESLTIKSDDAEGRERAALALLAGEEVEPVGEGRSLKLVEGALAGLGISVEEERL